MKLEHVLDYILTDKICLDMVRLLSPLDLLKTLARLGLIKHKTQARDIILKVNEEVWMEPVKPHQWAPPSREEPGDWPYDGATKSFMNRKNLSKQGLTK